MPSYRSQSLTDADAGTSCKSTREHRRVVVMGAARVGKTSIVNQFMYEHFPLEHTPTVEEMHEDIYCVSGSRLALEILDTSGSFQFPAMRELAIKTCDAFILVYSIDDKESFQYVSQLRDLIFEVLASKSKIPLVVVGNKCDLEEERQVSRDITESVVSMDWENGFVECSAKENVNVVEVFRAVLLQAQVCNLLVPAIERRCSLPNFSTSPQLRHALVQKRHSCVIQ